MKLFDPFYIAALRPIIVLRGTKSIPTLNQKTVCARIFLKSVKREEESPAGKRAASMLHEPCGQESLFKVKKLGIHSVANTAASIQDSSQPGSLFDFSH